MSKQNNKKSNVQTWLETKLRDEAELEAQAMGFDSLQAVFRLVATQLANKELDLNISTSGSGAFQDKDVERSHAQYQHAKSTGKLQGVTASHAISELSNA